jgi:hypothetical protein
MQGVHLAVKWVNEGVSEWVNEEVNEGGSE